MMNAGRVVFYVCVVGRESEIGGGIGENVNRGHSLRLDGVLPRRGNRKGDRVCVAARPNVFGKRAHNAALCAQHDSDFDRLVGFKAHEISVLRLVDRALATGPRRVVWEFGNARAIRVRRAGV